MDTTTLNHPVVSGERWVNERKALLAREKELMDDFTRRIAREQFALGHMQVGAVALPEIFPVLEGQMVPIEDIPKMVHEGKLETIAAEDLERKYEQFRQEFTVVYRKTLTLSRELVSETRIRLSNTEEFLGTAGVQNGQIAVQLTKRIVKD